MSTDFGKFMLEYNVIGVSLGTIVGFGLTNWTKEFRETVILPLIIDRYNITQYGDLVASTLEVIILFMIVYVIYLLIIQNMIKSALYDEEKAKKKSVKWKSDMLEEVKEINDANTEVKAHNGYMR